MKEPSISELFHKSCYTARSAGYKYRTLSTNTGEKKRRDTHEDNTFDKKLKELKREMSSRIENEVDQIADARESILDKFNKIDSKIDSMIALHKSVLGLRGDLQLAESKLVGMLDTIYRIECATSKSSVHTNLQCQKSSMRSQPPVIFEENELFESNITHV